MRSPWRRIRCASAATEPKSRASASDIALVGPAFAAQAREVQLVQQRGIERDQLLALQAVDDVARRLGEIERFELLGDGVQAPQRAAIVVLVMAFDELQRKAVQRPGTAVDLLQLIAHDDTSKHKLNCARTDCEHGLVPASVARRSQDWTGHRLGGMKPGGPVHPQPKDYALCCSYCNSGRIRFTCVQRDRRQSRRTG